MQLEKWTSVLYGSVNSKRAHSPRAFVIFFGKATNPPRWGRALIEKTPVGLKIGWKFPTQGQNHFWKICNNLIRLARKAPYADPS